MEREKMPEAGQKGIEKKQEHGTQNTELTR
jgi:hypothetical protein